MAPRLSLRMSTFLASLLVLTTLAVVSLAWLQRTALLSRYYGYRLAYSKESERQFWAERVAGVDVAAVPGLLGCLRQTDERVCANCRVGLNLLIERWEPGDDRLADLAGRLADVFPGLSAAGQETALELAMVLLQRPSPSTVTSIIPAITRTLEQAPSVADERVQRSGLRVARELLDKTNRPETAEICRQMTRAGLSCKAAENRVAAVRLAMRPGMDLSEPVVALLGDPVAEVRRAAMLMLGPEPATINTDDLLRWLHDPDEDVRRLCEKALRGRGLCDEHLRLGRLMTDGRPAIRLQVLDLLPLENDLEPGVWLRRLSHDSAPAVRAAAVRAAAEHTAVDLSDRLEQMAQNDPCPTVRQLAAFYLNAPRSARVDASVR